MKGFQPSRRGAAPDCSRSTPPGLVIADLGLPDAGLAAVALPAGLTAAFAAADVTHPA
jgi:hypothetical protein